MGKQGFGRWLLVVTWALITQHVSGSGKLEIRFNNFHGNGDGSNGNCCEGIASWGIGCGNACDPFFFLCLDRHGGTNIMNQCSIFSVQTGIFHEKNQITFGNNLEGVANPIVVTLSTVPTQFNIKVVVHDADPANKHDHMADLMTGVEYKPKANGVKGTYKSYRLHVPSGQATLMLEVRSNCDVYYYGETCTKKCVPNNGGYYSCDENGNKICTLGWQGVQCNQDIDECETDLCKNGANCTNLLGSFICNCTEDYKGFLCDEPKHECVINPCSNGGTCHGNETTEFVCDCLPRWGGKLCEKEIDPCEIKPCKNNGTCLANNGSDMGFVCTCEFGWTGAVCDSTTTTTSTTTPTTTTVFVVSYGDPYQITLLGEITDNNRPDLENGLIRLISELGGVQEKIYVDVDPQVVPIKSGLTTTYVEFRSGSESGRIDSSLVDEIFKYHSDDVINPYLPLPLYRPGVEVNQEKQISETVKHGDWVQTNWYVVVIPILIAIILVACIAAFLLITRRKKEKAAAFLRCESNVEPASATNMAFENVLYHETQQQQRQSEVLDGGAVTLNPAENTRVGEFRQTGACAEEPNPYSTPVQYDTPLKQAACACNGVSQYQNSNLATLDTRCDAGSNDYTDFSDLEGAKAKEENHYQELDDVLAQKVALSVGLPEETDGNISMDDSDDEDDIDKIKASFRDQTDA